MLHLLYLGVLWYVTREVGEYMCRWQKCARFIGPNETAPLEALSPGSSLCI